MTMAEVDAALQADGAFDDFRWAVNEEVQPLLDRYAPNAGAADFEATLDFLTTIGFDDDIWNRSEGTRGPGYEDRLNIWHDYHRHDDGSMHLNAFLYAEPAPNAWIDTQLVPTPTDPDAYTHSGHFLVRQIAISEPASLALFGSGLLALAWRQRRRH